jgi:hypothetical protein
VIRVEGVYSASEQLRRFYGYTIWVDCPYAARLTRGIEREGEHMRAMWVNQWMPAEQRCIDAERPDARADLVLDGSGSDAAGAGFRILKGVRAERAQARRPR